jgi:hypothetical protein
MDGLIFVLAGALLVIFALSYDNRHQHHLWDGEDDPTVADRPPTTDE